MIEDQLIDDTVSLGPDSIFKRGQEPFRKNSYTKIFITTARNSSDQLIVPIPRCTKFPDKDVCYTMAYTNSRDTNVQLIMEQVSHVSHLNKDIQFVSGYRVSRANLQNSR